MPGNAGNAPVMPGNAPVMPGNAGNAVMRGKAGNASKGLSVQAPICPHKFGAGFSN